MTYEWAIAQKILQSPIPFNIISNRGLPIDRAREELTQQAIATGATHLFFLDSDVILPADGLVRLYQHQLPIVAAIYGSKHELPGVWIQQNQNGGARYAPVSREVLEKTPLFSHQDMVIGMGACLIQLEVFKRIPQPWFDWTQGRVPTGVSEDFYFCEKVRPHIPIYVDTEVKCRHVDFSMLQWDGSRDRLQL